MWWLRPRHLVSLLGWIFLDEVLGTRLIKEHYSDVKVIILTTFKDDEYIKEALKYGASGYILKSQPANSIVETMRAVAQNS